MSESTSTPTSAPAAPASAPAPVPAETSSPPASSQPGISISEAARTLNRQRQQARQTEQGAPPPPRQPDRPAPRDQVREPPRQAEAQAEAAPRRETGSDAVEALGKALGLPDGATPSGQTQPGPSLAPSIDIDGRSYTHDQIKTLVSQGTDYTQKTQQLAEARRQVAQQQEALAQVLPYIQPELARLQQQIQGVQPPDTALIDTNPQEYMRQQAIWQAAQQEQNRLGQLTQLQQQALERAMTEQVERSNKALVDQLPGWADAKQRGEWQQAIAGWAMERGGYQRTELQGLADHRHLLTMAKAMMFDRFVSSAKTSAPMQAAPARGAPPPPAPAARVADAEKAFADRSSIKNAVQLIQARRSGMNGAAR